MTSSRRWPSRRFWVFTLGLCALVPLIAWWRSPAPLPPAKPYSFPTRELEELDKQVQARFAVVPRDRTFGLSRIGPRHGYFSPLTSPEKAVIAALQKSKTQVVFYVVGRNTILRQRNTYWFSPVQGPVYITPNAPVQVRADVVRYTQARFVSSKGVAKDAPTDNQLVDVARPIFNDPTLRLGTNAKINSWNIVARPVSASSQACVDCHNARSTWKTPDKRTWSFNPRADLDTVSLHDPLGIALYCYRPARKVALKKLSEEELLATGH